MIRKVRIPISRGAQLGLWRNIKILLFVFLFRIYKDEAELSIRGASTDIYLFVSAELHSLTNMGLFHWFLAGYLVTSVLFVSFLMSNGS